MKPDYKNWMPKGMVLGTAAGAAGCLGLAAVCGRTNLIGNKQVKIAASGVLAIAGTAAGGAALWMGLLYNAFPMTENGRCPGRSLTASPGM